MGGIIEYWLVTIGFMLLIDVAILVRGYMLKWNIKQTILFILIIDIIILLYRIYSVSEWLEDWNFWRNVQVKPT